MPDATHSQHLGWFSCTDVPKIQTLTPLKSQKTEVFETPCARKPIVTGIFDTHTCPLTAVSMTSPPRHTLLILPAFFHQLYAVYMRPNGFANSHTVFCTSHRSREGGQ